MLGIRIHTVSIDMKMVDWYPPSIHVSMRQPDFAIENTTILDR